MGHGSARPSPGLGTPRPAAGYRRLLQPVGSLWLLLPRSSAWQPQVTPPTTEQSTSKPRRGGLPRAQEDEKRARIVPSECGPLAGVGKAGSSTQLYQ